MGLDFRAWNGRMGPMSNPEVPGTIRLSDIVSALSAALDLTEGQPMGHAVRSCLIGMRIADELQLSPQDRGDLYYALLLKDAGCSVNAARMHQILGSDDIKAKREVKFEDWTKPSLSGLRYLLRNVLPGKSFARRLVRSVKLGLEQNQNNAEVIGARCERGAEIVRKIGMSEAVAQAIHNLDEHWNGGGYPEHRQGQAIPVMARIMNVSQTVEAFVSARGVTEAIDILDERSGTWFDPEIVRIVSSFESDSSLWERMRSDKARELVLQMEPGIAIPAAPARLDSICSAFAEVIDAKSHYTYRHSMGVAKAAVQISGQLGLSPNTVTMIRRAALLHDIGKLSVSNSILEKPGQLNESEWAVMKMHPIYTQKILKIISGFDHLAFIAGAHHERLDGRGYPNGLVGQELPLPARILCVADVYQALTEERPYRQSMPAEQVLGILQKDAPVRLDAECVEALTRQQHAAVEDAPAAQPASAQSAAAGS
jgi:putative nucleotidyltransferase with HDIG domain